MTELLDSCLLRRAACDLHHLMRLCAGLMASCIVCFRTLGPMRGSQNTGLELAHHTAFEGSVATTLRPPAAGAGPLL